MMFALKILATVADLLLFTFPMLWADLETSARWAGLVCFFIVLFVIWIKRG